MAPAKSRKLAAFGFLSADEVFRNGVVNAGILDQVRSCQWSQKLFSPVSALRLAMGTVLY